MELIDYRKAESLTCRLGDRLTADLGSRIAEARFVAIPRGGLFVLGMLSYALGLHTEQLEGEAGPDRLTIVVDDCSLSGARFARFLQSHPAGEVVFAHLASHPELRRSICSQEPRVLACLAAVDLDARPTPANGPEHWSAWHDRLGDRRYWLGEVEPVAFAWSEPDRVLWNQRTASVESSWRQASPATCLGNRTRLGLGPLGPPSAEIEVGPELLWKVEGETVVLWHSGRDRVYTLDGTGAAMFTAVVGFGDTERAAAALQGRFEVEAHRLRADLEDFVGTLVEQDLLVRSTCLTADVRDR